jgi:hypothetical protein
MGSVGAPTGQVAGGSFGGDSLDLQVAMASPNVSTTGVTGEMALYQRNVLRRDRLCLGFRYESQELAESEVWIGDNWVVEKAYGRTLVVDFGESTLTYIDPENGLWTETPLPLDLDALYEEDLRRGMRRRRSYGEVTETGRTRDVQDVTCREYRVNQWRIHDGMRHDHSTLKVWASEDPPYFSQVFAGFLDVLRQLYDRDADYRRELQKIRGLQLRLEFKEGSVWRRIRLVDSLDEIAVVPVPKDLFVAPEFCKRVKRLTELR